MYCFWIPKNEFKELLGHIVEDKVNKDSLEELKNVRSITISKKDYFEHKDKISQYISRHVVEKVFEEDELLEIRSINS